MIRDSLYFCGKRRQQGNIQKKIEKNSIGFSSWESQCVNCTVQNSFNQTVSIRFAPKLPFFELLKTLKGKGEKII